LPGKVRECTVERHGRFSLPWPDAKEVPETGLMWFRRDLRVQDNAALYHALKVM
jgi:hypothetical protein